MFILVISSNLLNYNVIWLEAIHCIFVDIAIFVFNVCYMWFLISIVAMRLMSIHIYARSAIYMIDLHVQVIGIISVNLMYIVWLLPVLHLHSEFKIIPLHILTKYICDGIYIRL